MLYKPASRKDAKIFKGTRLEHRWDEQRSQEQGFPAGYYGAEIVDVPQEPTVGDPGGIYFTICYDDQDRENKESWEDVEWGELSDWERCRITSLPPLAREYQLSQRSITLAKGKQSLGGRGARGVCEDPHLHLYVDASNGNTPSDAASNPESRPRKKPRTSTQNGAAGTPTPQKSGRTPAPSEAGGSKRKRGEGRGKTPGGDPTAQGSAGVVQSTGTQDNALPNGQGDISSQPDSQEREKGGKGGARPRRSGGWRMAEPRTQASPAEPPAELSPDRGLDSGGAPNGTAEEEGGEDEGDESSERPAPPSKRQKGSGKGSQRVLKDLPLPTEQEEDVGTFEPVEAGGERGYPGHVKRLVLENFMCHEHIAVDFISRVNFMCGQNGSGKTAVLHGLQMCLGVSAKQSGRVSTGGEFIRDGANHCKASATLWNTGEDAYLPRKYGPEITIVRDMKRTAKNGATSTWSLLDARGRKVAGKKADVEDLLKSLNVNAANPIVCLTQDTARSFGSNRADAERFRIYMEATQFDVIIERLKLSELDVQSMKSKIQVLHKDVKELSEELKVVDGKLERMEESATWEVQQSHLLNISCWEEVALHQKNVEQHDEKLAQAAAKIAHDEAALAAAEGKLQEAEEAFKAKEDAIADFPERTSALQQELQEQQNQWKQAKTNHNRLIKEVSTARSQLKEAQGDLEALIETLEETKKENQENLEGERQALATQLTAKLAEVESAEVAVGQARQDLKEAEAVLKQTMEGLGRQDAATKAASARVKEMQTMVQRLEQQSRGNMTEAFCGQQGAPGGGQKLQRLLQAIERNMQAGRFRKPPLGPIGSLLTIKDDKWATAIEVSVGKVFNSFVVHCNADSQLLKRLAAEIPGYQVPNILIYNYDMPEHNLSSSQVPQTPEDLPTVFRVVEVKDTTQHPHVIRNVLLDWTSAERQLLVEDADAAMEAVRGPLGRQRMISAAWDREGGHGVLKGRNETAFPPPPRKPYPRLRKDTTAAVREAKQELQASQGEFTQQQAQLQELRRSERAAKQAVYTAQRGVESASQRRQATQSQVDDLRSQHESQAQPEEASIQDLEVQIAEATHATTTLGQELSEKEQALGEAAAKEASEKLKTTSKKGEIDSYRRLHEAELTQQEECRQAVLEREHERDQKADTIRQVEGYVTQVQESKATAQQQLQRQREAALEVCSLEEVEQAHKAMAAEMEARREAYKRRLGDDVDVKLLLQRWLAELERKIADMNQDVGASKAELEEAKQKLMRRLKERVSLRDALELNKTELWVSYEARRAAASKMRKDTIQSVNNSFNMNLNRRAFTGSLAMNKTEQLLTLEVSIDASKNGGRVTDMKSLSGGERSFTNMCFVMAVGKQISSPFHCLDEFDVFMDAINRRLSIEMLIEFGADKEDLQLILLTPQSTHAIEDAERKVQARLKDSYPTGKLVLKRQMHAPRSA